MKMNSAAEPQGETQNSSTPQPGKTNLRLVKTNQPGDQPQNRTLQPVNYEDRSVSEVIDRTQDSIPAPDGSHEIDVDLSDLEAPPQTQRPAARLKPAREVKKDLFQTQTERSANLHAVDDSGHPAELNGENYFKLSTFSEVAARVQNTIPSAAERPQTVAQQPVNRAPSKSFDLDTAFEALDKHNAHQAKLADEVNDYVQEENRKVAEYQEARKSRGFFRKIADAANDIWNGTTHEERAAGKKGVAGFRGLFSGKEQSTSALMKKAGITPQELATTNSAPAQAVQNPRSAAKKSSWFRNLFKSQKETMKEIFEAGDVAETAQVRVKSAGVPATDLLRTSGGVQNRLLKKAGIDPTELAKMVDPDAPKNRSGFFRNLFKSSKAINDEMYESTGVDAEAEINLNPVTAGHTVEEKGILRGAIDGVKSAVSDITASVRGFIRKNLPALVFSTAAAGAIVAVVARNGGCGSGGGKITPPGLPHIDPISTASSSGEGGHGGEGQGGSAPDHKSADTEPVTPTPDVATAKTVPSVPNNPPADAKTVPLPKPPVVISPKTQETPGIPATQKNDRLAECKENDVPGVTVADCVVKEPELYRALLTSQLNEQERALDRVFAPIEKGPVFLGYHPFNRTAKPIIFSKDQNIQSGPKEAEVPKWKQNDYYKKTVADYITRVRQEIAEAKTLKQFYAVTDDEGIIGIGIDQLIVEREKQIAASYAAANYNNMHMLELKTRDAEERSGKKVIFSSVDGNKDGFTVTGSTITVTLPKPLRNTSAAEMVAQPAPGLDTDGMLEVVKTGAGVNHAEEQLGDSIDKYRITLPSTEKTVDAPHSDKKLGQSAPRRSRRVIPRSHTVRTTGTDHLSF